MSEYLAIRDEARRVLAHLYASIDDDRDQRLAARAREIIQRARRVLRRAPLGEPAKRELDELVRAIDRVRAAMSLAA
jgi:hypothetical protein